MTTLLYGDRFARGFGEIEHTGGASYEHDSQALAACGGKRFFIAACEGDDGAAGAAGARGNDGAAGAAGFSCWDLDQDGVADPEEDLNGDGTVDTLDCREPLPGEEIAVTGQVSAPDGPLDGITAVWFEPTGAAAAAPSGSAAPSAPPDAIFADVAADGSYEVALDEGEYSGYASRPGYQDVMKAVTVTQAGENELDFELPFNDDTYLGSEQCGVCHTREYASFVQTGHPFKLNKVVNGEQPIYPFTTLNGVLERIADAVTETDPDGLTDNTLGNPASWADVSYVIGGFFWKARFIDLDGAIVTGTETQYNFHTKEMASYNDGSVDKPYNCGNCHTTGWVHQDDVLSPDRQDDLPFMDGTFADGGVQCEACHAAGVLHARFAGGIERDANPRTLIELTADDAGFGLAVACGECHTRDGERDYDSYLSGFDKALALGPDGEPGTEDDNTDDTRPNEMGGRILVSGGFVRHHEQYDEILGIDPDTLLTTRSGLFLASHGDCNTCHNPHGSSVYDASTPGYTGMEGVDPTKAACLTCHGGVPAESYDPALRSGGMNTLDCVDCHMPKLAKSAVVTIAAEADRPAQGDVTSHIFTIDTSFAKGQFTADGKFAYPAIDEDWACRTCHNSASNAISISVADDLTGYIFHNNIVD